MKRKVSAANLSIAITFLLILLSFGFGYRSYSQAEQRVVSDLNQALQRTVLQNKGLWLNADTIQTYAKLQEVIGAPVSVNGSHRAFTEALSITGLKDVSTLSLHILKKNSPATVFNEIPAGCLASDTLVWLSTTADVSGLTLSFRGYARCSATMLFSLSKQTIPATLLLAAPQCGQRKDLLRWARVFLFFKMVISFFCVLLEFTQKTGGYPPSL